MPHGVDDDTGDPTAAATGDDVCSRYFYTFPAANAPYLIHFPNRIQAVGVNCASTPTFPQDALSDVRNYYDGAAAYSTAPSKGNVTKAEAVTKYSDTTPTIISRGTSLFDQWGRQTSVKDGRGKETKYAYTQSASGLTTTLKVTNPLAHDVVTTLDGPAWKPAHSHRRKPQSHQSGLRRAGQAHQGMDARTSDQWPSGCRIPVPASARRSLLHQDPAPRPQRQPDRLRRSL